MKIPLFSPVHASCVAAALLFVSAGVAEAQMAPTVEKALVNKPVTITSDANGYTMDNGIVRLVVNKAGVRGQGNTEQITYRGVNILHHGGVWEEGPNGQVSDMITIDPKSNDGKIGEIAVKGVNSGRMDIEERYTLREGESGYYTYAEYTHLPAYQQAGFGENRYCMEMNPTFDWLSVDADRNMLMASDEDIGTGIVIHAKEQHILSTGIYKNSVEHKYNYCGVLYKLPAFGWSSSKDHIGVYMINPSTEYIGGGASKLDLDVHMGSTLLDYWTSGHYAGGTFNGVFPGEQWKKVVGPIFIYFNALQNPEQPTQSEMDTFAATAGNPTIPRAYQDNGLALWHDALAKAKEIKAAWPFDWVQGMDYPKRDGRSAVSGQFVLTDPQAKTKLLPHLTVGLAHANYQGTDSEFVRRSGHGTTITWDHDAKYYQFWTDGAPDGTFTIPNVRPGSYVLHAFADGVLGEYAQANITVTAGQPLNLGKIIWKPVRDGVQVWDIGYPDRTGGKFFKGDGTNYWRWGWDVRYPLLFPNDVNYTVGKSDYHKDWFFEQVPHGISTAWLNPDAKDPANQPFGWVHVGTPDQDMWRTIGKGRADTWTINFNLLRDAHGTATLRMAMAGADGGGGLGIAVNGKQVGTVYPTATNALRYNTDTGVWQEQDQAFDSALLHGGENKIQLTVPAGDLTTGVVWDYLRLEVDENKNYQPGASNPAQNASNAPSGPASSQGGGFTGFSD